MIIESKIDELIADANKTVFWRQKNVVEENGKIQVQFHRGSVMQGDSLAVVPTEVKQFAEKLWGDQ